MVALRAGGPTGLFGRMGRVGRSANGRAGHDCGVTQDPLAALDRAAERRRLIAERRSLADRPVRDARLAANLRAWLAARPETAVGAYWPIRGEFDPLPVLAGWLAGGAGRQVALPVLDPVTDAMSFRAWWPGCPMGADRYGIPAPDGTPPVSPGLLLVPCVGFGPGGVRLGYGGGYYDRALAAMGVQGRPFTLGIAFAHALLPLLRAQPHDVPLDAILTEDGVVP